MTCNTLAETVSKIDHLTDEERECIEICNEAAEICEWCADECVELVASALIPPD